MKILFLTLSDIGDRSFGGAMRGDDIRSALLELGEVHTVVITGGPHFSIETVWDANQSRRIVIGAIESESRLGFISQRVRARREIAEIVRRGDFDVICSRYLGLAVYVPLRAWRKLIIDADDLVKSRPFGPSDTRRNARLAVRNFIARNIIRLARRTWFVNPDDFSRFKSGRSSLIANTVRLPDPKRRVPDRIQDRIVMVGYFMHPPNAEGARWFVDHVLPGIRQAFPAAELLLIGKCGDDFKARLPPHVRCLGFVENLSDEYAKASLVIAPILSGGGTQIKVIDALAHGRPLIASTFAYAGFSRQLTDAVHLHVADTADSWVAKCCEALRFPVESEAMAVRGREVAENEFGYAKLSSQVRASVESIMASDF